MTRRRAARGDGPTPRARRPLRLLAILFGPPLVLATGVAWLLWRGPTTADLRPIPGQNVLLITIDTLRADALGSAGGRAATPALDRLAAEGVRFDFAHAHAVTTLPSHVSIFTGLYPFQHGVRDNSGYRVAPDARTAATLLQEAGYGTAAFVGAFPVHRRFGLNRGFALYDDRFGETPAPTEFVMPERPASQVVALARAWIAQQKPGGSWFVWVHVFDPHAPYRPPPPFDAQYAADPYAGEVAATDAALAPLLDDVRASARPTVVIATGDHGEAFGDHGEQTHGLFAYEATLKVPLIVAEWGGDARAAQPTREVSTVSARHVDILPTILDAVGQALPPGLPGRSLLPASARRLESPPRPSYFEAMSGMLNRGWAPLTGVLVDRGKYIDLPIPEHYELRVDAAEQRNVAEQTAVRDRMLAATLRGFGAALPGARVSEAPDAAARLRALGYTSGGAAAKPRYTEADDPKRLVDLDQAVHRAVEAYGAGRAPEALQIYQQVLARRPDMAVAARHLAFIQWQGGDARGAIDTLQQALRHGSTETTLLTDLGGYLTDAGRVADAIAILEPAAASAAADADTLNALGIAYARAGRGADAARVFEQVLAVNPGSSVPLENLGVLALERNDLAAARAYFDRAVAANPRSSRAYGGLGAALSRGGERDAALTAWRKAVELDGRNFDALYNLGLTLVRAGRAQEAQPYLQQFLKTAPAALAADRREVERLLAR